MSVENTGPLHWIVLSATLLVLLAIDLLAHRGDRPDSKKSAIFWSVVWVGAGLAFGGYVLAVAGGRAAQEYIAAYLIEKSLSVDNLFVFLLVFQSLRIPKQHHKTVLSWGIFGALVFRLAFIFLGVAAMERFAWVPYVFGAILLYAAYKAFRQNPAEHEESKLVGFLEKHLPFTNQVNDGRFFVRADGRWLATPLLIAIFAVELTDLAFAIDSVPAALSVSQDRLIVYSSNAFAILGLRALYIVLSETLSSMKYLHYGLAGVLGFAAFKLLLAEWIHLPPMLSIGIIVATIGAAVWASLRAKATGKAPLDTPAQREQRAV